MPQAEPANRQFAIRVSSIARDAARERKLPEELAETVLVAADVRVAGAARFWAVFRNTP